jgi:hypothetical protein
VPAEEANVAKYMVLYRSSIPVRELMASATPEQAQAGMEAWQSWASGAGSAIVDLGAPLAAGRSVGGAAGGGDVTGYSVVEAESEDAAAALFAEHPHLHTPGDSSIEIRELIDMPGM